MAAIVSRSPSPNNISIEEDLITEEDLISKTNNTLIQLEQANKLLSSNPETNSIDKVKSLIDGYIAKLIQYKDELKKKFIDERKAKRDTVEIQTTINSIDIALLKNKKTGGKTSNRRKSKRKSKKVNKNKTKSKRKSK
jgi:hypothetical protein